MRTITVYVNIIGSKLPCVYDIYKQFSNARRYWSWIKDLKNWSKLQQQKKFSTKKLLKWHTENKTVIFSNISFSSGAKACVKLNQFEEAIAWCDDGLKVSFYNELPCNMNNDMRSKQWYDPYREPINLSNKKTGAYRNWGFQRDSSPCRNTPVQWLPSSALQNNSFIL